MIYLFQNRPINRFTVVNNDVSAKLTPIISGNTGFEIGVVKLVINGFSESRLVTKEYHIRVTRRSAIQDAEGDSVSAFGAILMTIILQIFN